MLAETCECGSTEFNISNLGLEWMTFQCVKCKASFRISFRKTKEGKDLKGVFVIRESSLKCPKCQAKGYDSEWDKDKQQYHYYCWKCNYDEYREF